MKIRPAKMLLPLVAAWALSACGVDVVVSAGTVGALKAEEAKNAKKNLEQVEKRMDEINQRAQQHQKDLNATQNTLPEEEQ